MALLPQQAALVRAIQAVHETIVECGDAGAPDGVIYAALMTQGCSLEQWERIRDLLVGSGLVEKRGNLLFAGRPGGAR